MKNSFQKSSTTRHAQTTRSVIAAFTLIELIAVIAIVAILSLTLLPALCRSASQTKVTACAANFRQWGVSVNLYAKDNKDLLPSFNPFGGAQFARDVG